MGRGKGGSLSHGKRTPGGIRTSSKMTKSDTFDNEESQQEQDAVVHNQISPLQSLSLPSKRTAEEISERFAREAPDYLSKHVKDFFEDDEDREGLSEETLYKRGGFVGKVFSRAREDKAMQEQFLKLRANSQLRNRDDPEIIENRMASHLQYLQDNNKPLEEDVNNLKLDAADPLNMSEDAIADIFYYKTLMSNPETREMVKEAYDNKDFMNSAMAKTAFDMGFTSGASDKTKEAMKQYTKPVHQMNLQDIENLRGALGEAPVKEPAYVKAAIQGQPLSAKIYSLVAPDLSPEESEALYPLTPKEMERGVKDFDRSEYGKRDDIPPLTDVEKYVLVEYTSAMYQRVNGYLRKVTALVNDYQSTDDPDIKKTMEDQMEYLMTDNYNMQTRIIATHMMNGLAKIMSSNKGEPRVVTRGSSQAPVTIEGIEEGKYFYDPGVKSSTIKDNFATPWGLNKNQFVLVTDKWVDARSFSRMQDGDDMDEDEMIIFPGTMFKADLVTGYKAKHTLPKNLEPNVVVGREVSVNKDGSKTLINPSHVKKEGDMKKLLIRDKKLEGGKEKVEDYQKRFKDIGGTLYNWLNKRDD